MTLKKEEVDIAYCGLCCDDYFNHKGEIAGLARDLRKIKEIGVEEYTARSTR